MVSYTRSRTGHSPMYRACRSRISRFSWSCRMMASSRGELVGGCLRCALEACTPPATGGAAHFEQLCAHLHRVASTLIRNRAAVVGNLVLTHGH